MISADVGVTTTEEVLDELRPDMIIVAAYGKILPHYIIEYPKYGCINVHASLLPKYRGAAPINACILNGETETGVTTMFMAEGMDTGDMILKKAICSSVSPACWFPGRNMRMLSKSLMA